jgi:DNA topoisomerase-1
VDIDKGFRPEYVTLKGREKVVRELKEAAAKAETIYLAPDPDREGEAIAWHLMCLLKGAVPPEQFRRITYHEITASAIRRALENPSAINGHKVDSQQARRVLDRLVGYGVSPLLWRRIRGASSAGRVQSVALRLVCEREREIATFKPEEYWLLGARVGKQVEPRDAFEVRLARIDGQKAEIGTSEQAARVQTDLDGRNLRVVDILLREVTRRALPPYITSSLQQAGSSVFGFAPARTMRLAQKLYEGMDFGEGPVGLITYMRTDSFAIAAEAQAACRAFIQSAYGPEYLPGKPNYYKSRSSAQEAHEAIRPTDVNRTPDQVASLLDPDEMKLYGLIWRRFVASQMAPARIAQRTVEVEAEPPQGKTSTYHFRATASDIVFPGYMKASGVEEKKKDENGDEIDRLPVVEKGEPLDLHEWLSEQKFTQPPPRFSEASLVKALEEHGIGRPSTYAQTLSTLVDRRYVEKEKRQLKPSALGLSTCDYLTSHLDALFNVRFTAEMESKLDAIEEGSLEWTAMLREFYDSFVQWLDACRGALADPERVKQLLDLLVRVPEWAPPSGTGRFKRDDRAFVESIRKQMEDGKKPLSDRQITALGKLAARYVVQVPELGPFVPTDDPGPPAPREVTDGMRVKLGLLAGIEFNEPRKIGKRVFDDRKFVKSFSEQVNAGRGLSENQERVLDRIVQKYRDRIPDFETRSKGLIFGASESGPAITEEEVAEILALLGVLKAVANWKPPVERRGRTWDDRAFYESLDRQFREKKRLSPKQLGALRKMARGYSQPAPGAESEPS